MKKKIAVLLSGVMVMASVLAGCGGGADSSSSQSSAESSSSETSEASSSAESSSAETESESAESESASSSSSSASGDASIVTKDGIEIPEGETIKVGYLAQNENDNFNSILGQAIEAAANEYGGQVELLKSDAQSIAANQVTQAEDMVTRGVDVLIINAVDQDASAPAVSACTAAGIPVVAMNTLVSNIDECVSYVGVDDREAGKIALEIIVGAIGEEGTVNIVQGLLGHAANENRFTGIENAIAEEYPGISIGQTQAADWDRNKAMNIAEDWLPNADDIDAVIALNDEMAISVSNVFASAGQDIPVVGIDALDEALELIIEGQMYGTVFQDAQGQGMSALNVAVMAALGEEVQAEYLIPFQPVTAENAEDYLGTVG